MDSISSSKRSFAGVAKSSPQRIQFSEEELENARRLVESCRFRLESKGIYTEMKGLCNGVQFRTDEEAKGHTLTLFQIILEQCHEIVIGNLNRITGDGVRSRGKETC
ncbi:Hypothetical predicted protein [Octopus vulgaris]|uniref:Uncharacterized protein n=1 Tax=Octopus vulgaris TaxID=6645 RepID=A0AA36BBS4_OCTVU|nr:Hypothetical predicted protein [Octopus vulgaris]